MQCAEFKGGRQVNSTRESSSGKVAVIGAGAFGSALAVCSAEGGNSVTLFGREENKLEVLQKLPEFKDISILKIPDHEFDWQSFDIILLATPTQTLRSVVSHVCKTQRKNGSKRPLHIVSAAKGIEQKTLYLPHQIISDVCPKDAVIGCLSGPSFAKELRANMVTAVVVASKDQDLNETVGRLLHRPYFRVYETNDVVGVEMAGALKNVIAVVAGGCDGMKLGNNARAAVITRGLGEIAQLGVKLGADPMTFLGLSGLGDLILTATGDLSRNRQFGFKLASGEKVEDIISNMGEVVEGYTTARSAYHLAQKLNCETPILTTAYKVLYEGIPLKSAISGLLHREGKSEFNWLKND